MPERPVPEKPAAPPPDTLTPDDKPPEESAPDSEKRAILSLTNHSPDDLDRHHRELLRHAVTDGGWKANPHWKELSDALVPAVYSCLRRLGLQHQDILDIIAAAQEKLLLHVTNQPEQREPDWRPRHFFFRVAFNLAVDSFRRRERQAVPDTERVETAISDAAGSDELLVSRLEQQAISAGLRDYLLSAESAPSPEQVDELLERLRNDEIELLDVLMLVAPTRGAAYTRKNRLKKDLGKKLEKRQGRHR